MAEKSSFATCLPLLLQGVPTSGAGVLTKPAPLGWLFPKKLCAYLVPEPWGESLSSSRPAETPEPAVSIVSRAGSSFALEQSPIHRHKTTLLLTKAHKFPLGSSRRMTASFCNPLPVAQQDPRKPLNGAGRRGAATCVTKCHKLSDAPLISPAKSCNCSVRFRSCSPRQSATSPIHSASLPLVAVRSRSSGRNHRKKMQD